MKRMVVLLAWFALLAAVLASAVHLGRGALATPPLRPATWSAWLEARGAAAATVALLRLVVIGLCAYLLVATALAVLATPVLPTPAFVRTLVGAALLSSLVLAPSASRREVAGSAVLIATSSDEAPVLRLLDDPEPTPVVDAAPPTWTVQPGDHLWSIAERTLTTRLGRAPSDAEVVPFWHALIETNRDRLADRDNPDLVFAGQTFVLPHA